MYEAEVNSRSESIETLPADVVTRFSELRSQIASRTVLPWGEHCTECAWPTCYTTCELYAPRLDGNCRLFVDGMVRLDLDDGPGRYLLKLRFKRWGKLWTVGNLAMYSMREVRHKEKRNMLVGAVARSAPLPRPLKSRVLGKVAYLRRRDAESAPPSAESPDCFLLECYNPNAQPVELTLTIRPRQPESPHAFQRAIRVAPGFFREHVSVTDILRTVDLTRPFEVEIVPNEAEDTPLYFGLLDFVRLHPRPSAPATPAPLAKPWKCIVWDLDNTLWEGTLIEDGPDAIRLRPEAVAVIKETDRRGILHSVASKNNHAEAMAALRRWGLDEYFLHPQITWEPKSQSLARIAQLLNIGVDSLAFVDDQPFEREEVRAALPQVALVDAAEFLAIPARPECQVPITEESQQRRLMYRQEEQRERILQSFGGDYTRFLRECQMELVISRLSEENLERVYELAQRTNQMNYSGSRYPRAALREIQQSATHETYVMRCADRFGGYGIVGFAVVDTREPRLLDLMFSCRIQSKRVEHAFLGHVLDRFSRPDRRDFFANYRRTEKNAPAGQVFDDLGFELVGEQGGVLSLVFRKPMALPRQDIVRIVVKAGADD
jgi:FkbH-like protein